MSKIGQSPRNWLVPDCVQQGPRTNTALPLARQHCANLPAKGDIPLHLSQPAVIRASLTPSAKPQKAEKGGEKLNFENIRKDTKDAFGALSKCEENVYNNFSTKKNPDTQASDKKNSNLKKAYKIWRDSPADLPKEVMEKNTKAWRDASQSLGRSYKDPGAKKLIEVLKQNATLESKIDPFANGFRDVKTGLYCELHQVNFNAAIPEYVLCFPGTGAGAMDRMQWLNNIDQAIGTGEVPPAYKQAAELTELIKTTLDKTGAKLTVAGHSLGGGIANYVGLKHDIQSVCYNAAPLGGACLRDLGSITEDKLEKQLHIRCKGDAVSSPKVQQKLQSFLQIWNKEKIWVPRNAGTICNVNKDYAPEKRGFDRHLLSIFDPWYSIVSLPPKVNINLLLMA